MSGSSLVEEGSWEWVRKAAAADAAPLEDLGFWERLKEVATADAALLVASLVVILLLAIVRMRWGGTTFGRRLRPVRGGLLLFAVGLVVVAALPREVGQLRRAVHIAALLCFSYAIIRAGALLLFDFLLGTRRKRPVPRIVSELTQTLVFIVVALVVLGSQGVDITSIITTSAILTAVIGLALQDILTNVLAGLALQVEKPFDVGDWLSFQVHYGKVIEIGWRSTRLRTLNNNDVVVPNSLLTRDRFVNYSRPNVTTRRTMEVGISYEHPPYEVKATLIGAMKAAEGVLNDPPPEAVVLGFGDFAITYEIRFWVADFGKKEPITDRVMSLIWYHLKREGFSIPFPIRDVRMREVTEADEGRARQAERRRRLSWLHQVPVLTALDEPALALLVDRLTLAPFAEGEDIVEQGDEGRALFIIEAGTCSVRLREGDRPQREVARLGSGDFFGEMSLLAGEARQATVTAVSDCRLYRLDADAFRDILAGNDALMQRISEILARRQAELHSDADAPGSTPAAAPADQAGLLSRIRLFFGG